jgi:hypothetical protein
MSRTQLKKSGIDASVFQSWLDYRQALRDLPQTFSNPDEIVWPTKPQ